MLCWWPCSFLPGFGLHLIIHSDKTENYACKWVPLCPRTGLTLSAGKRWRPSSYSSDTPISSDRKAVVDQGTDFKLALPGIQGVSENPGQLLSTAPSHRPCSCGLGVHVCSQHQRACETIMSHIHSKQWTGSTRRASHGVPLVHWEGLTNVPWRPDSCFYEVLGPSDNFQVGQQMMGRTQ